MKTLTKTELTPKQQKDWTTTRATLMFRCPAFTHILFSMLNNSKSEQAAIFTTDVPIAATDGSALILNPETFFEFNNEERVFVVAHEIMHCVMAHNFVIRPAQRSGVLRYPDGDELPYDHETMNIALDLIINDMLIHDNVGKMPPVGVHDPSIAGRDDGFMEAYRKVYKKRGGKSKSQGGKQAPSEGGGSGSGTGKGNVPGLQDVTGGKGGFDELLDPGTSAGEDPQQAEQGRSQVAWDTALAAAAHSARLQGRLPAGLERLLTEIVDPTVPWQEHIRAAFARRVGGGGYDWRRPDRNLIIRDIYAPRRSGNGTGTIVVAVDTSGSIGQKELNQFFGEMVGIIDDVRPSEIHVVWCDAKVHKVDTVEEAGDIATLKPAGGGGTDFRPVFDWIEESDVTPEALVYLTDGYGSFPAVAPSYPVIWGDIIQKNGVTYPFGDVVKVTIK